MEWAGNGHHEWTRTCAAIAHHKVLDVIVSLMSHSWLSCGNAGQNKRPDKCLSQQRFRRLSNTSEELIKVVLLSGQTFLLRAIQVEHLWEFGQLEVFQIHFRLCLRASSPILELLSHLFMMHVQKAHGWHHRTTLIKLFLRNNRHLTR
jgi:hypothetical protein